MHTIVSIVVLNPSQYQDIWFEHAYLLELGMEQYLNVIAEVIKSYFETVYIRFFTSSPWLDVLLTCT